VSFLISREFMKKCKLLFESVETVRPNITCATFVVITVIIINFTTL
jgi:hypothetical protein